MRLANAGKAARQLVLVAGVCATSLISGLGYAGTSTGYVSNLIVSTNSLAYVSISGGNYASCATYGRYAIELSTVGGRALYATLLAAKVSGHQLVIVGTGTCNQQPNDAEDIVVIDANW